MNALPLCVSLLTVSLTVNAQTFPKYKSSDPAAISQRNALTKASRMHQSQRALDSTGAPLTMMMPPDGGGGGGGSMVTVVIPVYRDGYRVTGSATANYSQWTPGNYMGGASISNWGARMPVPYWNPEKASFQMGPDLGVQQAQTFWFPGRTPDNLSPWGAKPYFAKPTYHHGTNTVSSFSTYWGGYFSQVAGAFYGTKVPEFDVLNNSHNEGGMDHPSIAMVNGFPNVPYEAGTDAEWTANHSEWYWPSPGSCYLTSMELWDSVRTGYGSVSFTFEVPCVSGIQDNGEIEVPASSLNGLWGQYEVVESVVLSAPISVEKYTETTYVSKVVPNSTFNNTTQADYILQQSAAMSQRAVEWPNFVAESPKAHNVGSAVFIKVTTKLQ